MEIESCDTTRCSGRGDCGTNPGSDGPCGHTSSVLDDANSYQWSGGVVPSEGVGELQWYENQYPTCDGSQIFAVNPGTQSSDVFTSFAAEALFGVGASVAVGALTEFWHLCRQRGNPPKQTDQTTPEHQSAR